MKRYIKHGFVAISAEVKAQMFVFDSFQHFCLRILFRLYGMVSLGQYVVNCFVPSGSKPSLKCNRGEKYSCFSNFDDKPGAKQQVLDAEKLIEDEQRLCCEQNKPCKDGFYRNFNNPRIENLAKSRGAKTERNEKCFCRSSQTQFRSTTPRHVKKSLRLRRPFNENDQQHQQDNDFFV